jgi:hypothetical protein
MHSRIGWSARRLVVGLLLGMVVSTGPVWAQGQIGSKDDCRNTSAVADVTVSTTAIQVVAANQGLCGATVINTSASDKLRCRSIRDGAPTSTLGLLLGAGGVLELKLDSQPGWFCIRDTSATGDVVVNITLSLP